MKMKLCTPSNAGRYIPANKKDIEFRMNRNREEKRKKRGCRCQIKHSNQTGRESLRREKESSRRKNPTKVPTLAERGISTGRWECS
jgi:hypothetical protein